MCYLISIVSIGAALLALLWCVFLLLEKEQRINWMNNMLSENNRLRLEKKTLRARLSRQQGMGIS
jgi:hypothetical protein